MPPCSQCFACYGQCHTLTTADVPALPRFQLCTANDAKLHKRLKAYRLHLASETQAQRLHADEVAAPKVQLANTVTCSCRVSRAIGPASPRTMNKAALPAFDEPVAGAWLHGAAHT